MILKFYLYGLTKPMKLYIFGNVWDPWNLYFWHVLLLRVEGLIGRMVHFVDVQITLSENYENEGGL